MLWFCCFLQSQSIDTLKLPEINVLDQNLLDLTNSRKRSIVNSTDDFLKQSNKITVARRANFAAEPIVRGLSGTRTQVRINDVPIFGACVDNMDPASSYLELNSIEKLEADACSCPTDASAQVNFTTAEPNFRNKFEGNLFSNFSSVNLGTNTGINLDYSTNRFASKITFINRSGSDFFHGNGESIHNSGFAKQNATALLSYKLDTKNQFELNYTADWSQNVGFPALIMDTRTTRANLLNLEHSYGGF